jgi:DNA (cytosine-5)-methyltransferase 1
MSQFTLVDLFCGAGGLSLGLEKAGFKPLLAIDNWPAAQQTFSMNFPKVPFLLADARSLSTAELIEATGSSDGSITLIAGGPPCQGFSSAGKREASDPRNTLVGTFANLVAQMKPRFFLFENVEGFLTAGGGAAVTALVEPLIDAGYQIHIRKVNAANYGVPQLRKRVIAIGALGLVPSFPEPTCSAYGAPGAHLAGRTLQPTPTLEAAIADLENPAGAFSDHVRQPLEGLDLERSRQLKPGQTMRDLPLVLQHGSFKRRANRRVRDGTPTERRGGAPAGLRRLRADEPAKAITSAAVSEFLHYRLDAFLTIRECARLQTFPDHFQFSGPVADRALLIGNAVPPALSEIIGRSILKDIVYKSQSDSLQPDHGKLWSFIPTLSGGMSPALTEVVYKVVNRYMSTKKRHSDPEQLRLHA